ncbi:MAG: peptidoglycan-binding protein [Clostridia bacterium]|nr:peptidoglycan-binding protein [Clostridia bacterium]
MKRTAFFILVLLLVSACLVQGLAEDHRFGGWVTLREPTCSREGHQKRYCLDCDHWEQQEIKKLPHTVDTWEVTKEPTCYEDGVRVATCKVCGGFLRVKIDKLGHNYVGYTYVKEPTCNSQGKGDMICTRCGRIKKDTTIPKLEHQWSDWVLISEPKGKKKGVREHTCQLCGKKEQDKFYYEGTLYEGMDANFTVVMLQVMLRDLGYYSGNISTGTYGGITEKAVAKFQKKNGISSTGVADPYTVSMIRQKWESKTGRPMASITMEDAKK